MSILAQQSFEVVRSCLITAVCNFEWHHQLTWLEVWFAKMLSVVTDDNQQKCRWFKLLHSKLFNFAKMHTSSNSILIHGKTYSRWSTTCTKVSGGFRTEPRLVLYTAVSSLEWNNQLISWMVPKCHLAFWLPLFWVLFPSQDKKNLGSCTYYINLGSWQQHSSRK